MAASDHLNPEQHRNVLGRYPDQHTTSVEAAAAWERNMNTEWDYPEREDDDDYSGDSDAGDL